MKINWDINILYLMSLISEEKISMNDNNSYNKKDIQALMAKVKVILISWWWGIRVLYWLFQRVR